MTLIVLVSFTFLISFQTFVHHPKVASHVQSPQPQSYAHYSDFSLYTKIFHCMCDFVICVAWTNMKDNKETLNHCLIYCSHIPSLCLLSRILCFQHIMPRYLLYMVPREASVNTFPVNLLYAGAIIQWDSDMSLWNSILYTGHRLTFLLTWCCKNDWTVQILRGKGEFAVLKSSSSSYTFSFKKHPVSSFRNIRSDQILKPTWPNSYQESQQLLRADAEQWILSYAIYIYISRAFLEEWY